MNPHILVVEDEPKLAQLLGRYLEREEYGWTHLADGMSVMPWLAAHTTDLILLDLNLPGRDGLTLCREIRASLSVPVIMTTARIDEIDRLLGLELGADDYVCKPYSPRELMARIKAVLRRTRSAAPNTSSATEGHGTASASTVAQPAAPHIRLDEDRLAALVGAETVIFTVVEFQLFRLLMENPGRIFSRDQLMDRIYRDQRVVNDRTIDSHIKKLRRKLESAWPHGDLIHAVYGAGYTFRPGG